MRRAAKIDSNQPAVVEALRRAGASVQPLHTVGQGVPDLLVGFRQQDFKMEIKDGSLPPSARRLTPDQERWHAEWDGSPVHVVTNVGDALRVIGLTT